MATSALLARARRRPFALGWSSRLGLGLLLRRSGLLADALHVARFANEPRHLGETAALDADVGENGIDQRRLDAVAQGRVDHFVGRAASAPIAAAIAAGQAVDVQNADALDLLHRLGALAHNALDPIEQLAAEQRVAGLVGEHVLGLVEQFLALGLDRRPYPFGLGGDALLFGFLLRDEHFDGLAPLGDLAVAHGDDALGGFGRARLGGLRFRLRGGMLERLLLEDDRFLHQRCLDILLAVNLQFTQIALAPDAGLVEAAVRSDARALDFLVGGDLGFLQGLDTRDFELFDHAPALQPRCFQRLLPRHFGGFDV